MYLSVPSLGKCIACILSPLTQLWKKKKCLLLPVKIVSLWFTWNFTKPGGSQEGDGEKQWKQISMLTSCLSMVILLSCFSLDIEQRLHKAVFLNMPWRTKWKWTVLVSPSHSWHTWQHSKCMFTGFVMFTEQADFCSHIFVLLISHCNVRKTKQICYTASQRLVTMPSLYSLNCCFSLHF